MSIAFNDIPNDLRVPLAYVEFDSSGALKGIPAQGWKLLLIGQKLAVGSAKAGEAMRVTRRGESDLLFGAGSMLANMVDMARAANPYLETWCIALSDDAKGHAATASLTVLTPATAAGSLSLLIGGQSLRVAVAENDSVESVARKIHGAIEGKKTLDVSSDAAKAAQGELQLTAKHTGESGNGISVIVNYFAGDVLPAGLTLRVAPLAGGSGNPDITEAIAGFGDERWKSVVMPYTDAQNMKRLEAELLTRWGPMRMSDGIAWGAFRGTLAESSAFGDSHNGFLMSCMATNDAPHPPHLWAAVYGMVASTHLEIDPARPLQTLELPGLLPPLKSKRWTREECELLLKDGMATHEVAPGDAVVIQREITMYQKDQFGQEDISYLDVTTPATLSFIRTGWVQRVQRMFGRHKLANDGTRFGPGQPVVTPKILTTQALAYFTELERMGLVENFEQYKQTLIVERNKANPNRLDMLGHPDLINQFRILADQIQFVL